MNKTEISFFLNFGFLHHYDDDSLSEIFINNDLNNFVPDSRFQTEDESFLVKKGAEILKAAFNNINDGTHIVPLSGGFDSRVMLAALMEAGYQKKTIAVTFGKPGTYYHCPARHALPGPCHYRE